MSSESSQGNAEVRETEGAPGPEPAQQSADTSRQAGGSDPVAGQANFGANEWLVEELYQRYLADPASVDRAWWSFFADYQPALRSLLRRRSPRNPRHRRPLRGSMRPKATKHRKTPRRLRLIRRRGHRPRPPPLRRPPRARRLPLAHRRHRVRRPRRRLHRLHRVRRPRRRLPRRHRLLRRAHPKLPRSAGCAVPRRAPSPT
jgi:hypothetical protein